MAGESDFLLRLLGIDPELREAERRAAKGRAKFATVPKPVPVVTPVPASPGAALNPVDPSAGAFQRFLNMMAGNK